MDFKQTAIKAAKKAAEIQLELSKKEIKFSLKSKHDVLAEADILSEKAIIETIKNEFPDHKVLSEEAGEESHDSDYFWIIDPVDGTINFTKGIDEYCISIGLEHKGERVLGVIYQPTTEKMFIAEKGKGAFLNGEKLEMKKDPKLINMVAATDNSADIGYRKENLKILRNISGNVRTVRIFGSSALHLARLAIGNMDLYFKTGINYWDFAAGILIVEEAGGKVTDFNGDKVTKDSRNIVVSNGLVHEEFLSILNQAN